MHKSSSGQWPETHLVLGLVDHTLGYQQLCILLQHWLLFPDLLVHEWLCEHGLVHLVVAISPVAYLGTAKMLASGAAGWTGDS